MTTGTRRFGQYSGVASPVARLEVTMPAHDRVVLPEFHVLYEEHFDLVWHTARRLGVPEASIDDVMQDVFLILHRRRDEYDGQTPVRRWILGMTIRVVSDHRRRYRRKDARCVPQPADSNGDVLLPSDRPTPSAAVEIDEQVRLLDELLGQLPHDLREVLVLSELEEMTAPEIGQLLGVNVNTIYTRLRTARQQFEKLHARHQRRGQ